LDEDCLKRERLARERGDKEELEKIWEEERQI